MPCYYLFHPARFSSELTCLCFYCQEKQTFGFTAVICCHLYFDQIKPLIYPTKEILAIRNIKYKWHQVFAHGLKFLFEHLHFVLAGQKCLAVHVATAEATVVVCYLYCFLAVGPL